MSQFSALFSSIGLPIVIVLCLAVVSLAIVSGWLVQRLKKLERLNRVFLEGKGGKSLEGAIIKNDEKIKALDGEIQELYDISNKINTLAQKSLHRVGMVRFNPFKDIGGDQSFAVAVLDGKNSGFTLSSLHTREGTRVYVKPVTRGESKKYTLTDEEIKAISIASRSKDEDQETVKK